MTIDEARQKVLDLARSEIGYHETGENQTKYAAAYNFDTRLYGFDMSGQPWCDYLVDWLFMKAFGFELGSSMTYQYAGCCGAACASSAGYYRQKNAFFQTPEVGDQIFFHASGGINHTGVVESISDGYVTTIEGNSSDMVRRNQYRVSDPSIAGYGRPAWSYATTAAQNPPALQIDDDPEEPDELPADDASVFVPLDRNILRYGSVGAAVTALQALLNYYFGPFYLDIDSEFGPLTECAVIDFQKSVWIAADGIVGPETWAALLSGARTTSKKE